jgi:UDP-glucose 4-epimerase
LGLVGQDDGVLIYGGGLIGGVAARALSEAGVPVTVVTKAPSLQKFDNIDWRFGNLAAERPDSFIVKRQAIVYAAGSLSPASLVPSIAQLLASQIIPVVELAEQAARLHVPSFVFISSGGTVYGRTDVIPTNEGVRAAPINAYGMIKAQTEQALMEIARRSDMRVIILRVSNPYGPGQQGTRRLGFIAAAIEAAARREPLTIWGDGLSTRDFVYLSDVADAVLLSTRYDGDSEIFNIGAGCETSLLQICDLVREIAGTRLEVRHEEARSVDVRRSSLDIGKAGRLLKWNPKISLRVGISNTINNK